MHSLTIVAIAATSIFSFTSAAPTKRSSSLETGFTINQVANPNFSGRHGPSHYAKAARKYGLEVSIKTTAAAVTGAAMVAGSIAPGSIGANPVGSGGVIVEYICPVTIGSQEFQLDFDTGSSDLWVSRRTDRCSRRDVRLTITRLLAPEPLAPKRRTTLPALPSLDNRGAYSMEMVQQRLATCTPIP